MPLMYTKCITKMHDKITLTNTTTLKNCRDSNKEITGKLESNEQLN